MITTGGARVKDHQHRAPPRADHRYRGSQGLREEGSSLETPARLHVPRPGLAAPRHGPPVARPRELGTGRGGDGARRPRRRSPAARRRRRGAEGHPQRPALHVRHEPDGRSTPSSALASSPASAPVTASASTRRSPRRARSPSRRACGSSASGPRRCTKPASTTRARWPPCSASTTTRSRSPAAGRRRRVGGQLQRPGSVVIAGSADGVNAAGGGVEGARRQEGDAAARVRAFHTPYMAPAATGCARPSPRPTPRHRRADRLQRRTRLPTTVGASGRACLSAQLSSPVRWKHCLLALAGAGVTDYVELGPGGVLTGMAKRTVDARCDALDRHARGPRQAARPHRRRAGSTAAPHEGEHLFADRAPGRQPGGRRLHAGRGPLKEEA